MNKIKTSLSLIALLLVCVQINFGQNGNQPTMLIPGTSAGDLKIGMNKKEVNKLLHASYNTRSFAEECSAYLTNGYYLDSMVQCRLGFDEVWDFNGTPSNLPVFKLFFKKNELCYAILSSYGFQGDISKFELQGGIHYNDTVPKILKAIGEPETKGRFKAMDNEGIQSNDIFYEYWSKGLELYIDDERLTVIYLFKPTTNLFTAPVSKQLLKIEKKLKK